jgi:tetratricopeptide (TPR) repeat protein
LDAGRHAESCRLILRVVRKQNMAKRTQKKSAPKMANKKSSSSKSDSPLPAPHFAEQILQGAFGGSRDRTFDAQEHAYNAMEAMANENWALAEREAIKAIKLDLNCADALTVMSQLGSENETELVDNLRRTVERGEKSLGKKFFQENAGWFWGLLETRPYMRARAHLAALLNEAGQIDEAIGHWEEMLRLNPNDNQGLRYPLLGGYLEQGNLSGVDRVFSEYPDEGSAMFAWARLLASVFAGKESAAAKALADARKANKHVEAYLIGRKKMPADGRGYYSPGEPSEAIVCMFEIGSAWKKHPAAIDWLKRQKVKRT